MCKISYYISIPQIKEKKMNKIPVNMIGVGLAIGVAIGVAHNPMGG